MTDYMSILPVGKANAISTRDLTTVLGFSSPRVLQDDIARARSEGQLILSSVMGGYFLPANDEEVQEFVRTLEARAINTLAILKAARQYLRKDKGQMTLDELEGIDELAI